MHVTGFLIIFRWFFPHEGWIRNLLLFISLAILLGLKANLLGYILLFISIKVFSCECAIFFFLFLTLNDCEQTKGEKYFIHNHLAFTVKFHRDLQTDSARIVGFEVKPFR
jgi:hypothetical protein